MARGYDLAAVSVFIGLAGSPAALADGASIPDNDTAIGFLSLKAPSTDANAVSLSLVTTDASPDAELGLAPSRGLALDYAWGSGLRTELRSQIVANGLASVGAGAAASQTSVMGSMVYDFALPATALDAHIGAGLGIDQLQVGLGPANRLTAFEALAGTEYALSPDLKLGAEYRFLATSDPTGLPPRYNPGGHSLLLTLRYDWGAATAGGLAQVMPPPALLAAPHNPITAARPDPVLSFDVAFDSDKADLSQTAIRILQDAADGVRAGSIVRISIIGHTDTVGAPVASTELSANRLATVRRMLLADGVPAAALAAQNQIEIIPEGD